MATQTLKAVLPNRLGPSAGGTSSTSFIRSFRSDITRFALSDMGIELSFVFLETTEEQIYCKNTQILNAALELRNLRTSACENIFLVGNVK